MRFQLLLVGALLAALISETRATGTAAAERDAETTAASHRLDAYLATRGRVTEVWDSTIAALTEEHVEALPDVSVPLGGVEGPREGDMDQVLRRFAGEPGVARHFFPFEGRGIQARAFAVSQTPQGRILMAGQIGTPDSAGLPTRIGFVQYTHSGTVDTSFNGSGVQTFDFANPRLELVGGIALTESLNGAAYDRVYLLARDFELASGQTFALICMRRPSPTAAFEPCAGFGPIRYYAFALAAGCPTDDSIPAGIHLHRGNPVRIFMVGSTRRGFNDCQDFDWAVAKVDLAGELDTGFGGSGRVAYWIPNSEPGFDFARARTATVRALGNHLVVGGSTGTGNFERAIVAQFNPNGTLDTAFCAAADTECPSPPGHRNGRRSWESDATGAVTAIAATLGEGVYTVRRVGAVGAIQQFGAIARVDQFGRCNAFCNDSLLVPVSAGVYEPVAASWESRSGGFRLTIAGWGSYENAIHRHQAYVYRFRNVGLELDIDDEFVSRQPVSWRQDIDWPYTGIHGRDAQVHAMAFDRQGRVLLGGSVRAVDMEYDMGLARLQGRLQLFANGFE